MTQAKHTKGPFEFDSFGRGYILKDGIYLAELVDEDDDEGLFIRDQAERNANGRLFAAAPDLYAALLEAEALLREYPFIKQMARKALAKAKGEL